MAKRERIVEKLEKLMAPCEELEASIRESKHYAETLVKSHSKKP